MKKILSLLFLTGFLFSLMAAPAAAPTSSVNKYLDLITYKLTAFDTLSGVDSSTIANKISIPTGCSVILARAAITGTGADSVNAQVVVDAYDINNKFLYRTIVDTIATVSSACPGEQIALPINDSIFGDKYTIKIISLTGAGAGGEQILNSIRIYVRKVFLDWHQYVGN